MKNRQRMLVLAAIDTCIVATAVVIAYLLRFDFDVTAPFSDFIPYTVFMYVACALMLNYFEKIYRRVWTYASIGELLAIFKATSSSAILLFVLHLVANRVNPDFAVPRSIYVISWALIILGVGGSRFAWRLFRDTYFKIQPSQQRTLIIGAGYAGALVAKELRRHADSELYPVAFIDDDPVKSHREIMGLPVIGGRDQIIETVKALGVTTIIIAMPSVSKSDIAAIIDICKNTKASIRILPHVSDFINGKVSVNAIREVRVEDLLGRDPVQVDLEGVANYVSDQVVLVTGAGGSIGSELCRQIAPFRPNKLLLLGHGENSIYDIELELRMTFPNLPLETVIADIQDRGRMEEVFRTFSPAVVFHAAAHKHVPLMERNPREAIRNNVLGTKNVAECAHEFGVTHFVMISSDKAVNPTSVMGVTKRVAEMLVQGLNRISNTKFVAVRFGNVLGSRGSVIPVFKRQIEHGGPLTITHPDMVRYFMTIPEAVQLVIQAGALAQGGEIFILDMGEPVKILNLARDLIRLSGLEPDKDIKIIFTGIREGEKLFEEILTNEEGITATKHDRIFVGQPQDFSWEQLLFMVRKLEATANHADLPQRGCAIRELLLELVPSYQYVPVPSAKAAVGGERGSERAVREIQRAIEEAAASNQRARE